MNVKDKVSYLTSLIDEKILPLITSDYVFWGLPYYVNPGDTLIWEGALQMLKKSPYKCLGTCGWDDYKHVPLSKDTVILVIGGGFFGDVWRKAWDNVMDTITLYPDNPIVILPQSVFYESEDIAQEDAKRLSKLKRLTICTRDQQSFDYAQQTFTNNVLLVPDLAFHCNINKLSRFALKQTDRILYLKRRDKELPSSVVDLNGVNVDQRDWPAMSGEYTLCMRIVSRLIYECSKIRNNGIRDYFVTFLYKYGNRNVIIRDAVRFISPYKEIHTTRLHVMVLSFLLGKRVFILDNSYGKISGCYKAWLYDVEDITLV